MIHEDNAKILDVLAIYLNNYPSIIKEKEILEITKEGVSKTKAFLLAFLNHFPIDENLFFTYFPNMVHEEKQDEYKNNPYFQNVRPKEEEFEDWEVKYSVLKPYEAFVRNDFKEDFSGRLYPQLGFFTEEFQYLSIYQDKRLWMSITPNEMNTMKKPIENAFGDCVVLGLGLGYFPYMISLKENVTSITIVEIDYKAIQLFYKTIYPFFPHKEKIHIVNMDALDYINMDFEADYVFADLWHDVGDGLPLYKKIKRLSQYHPDKVFDYWIYDTMKYYLKTEE